MSVSVVSQSVVSGSPGAQFVISHLVVSKSVLSQFVVYVATQARLLPLFGVTRWDNCLFYFVLF